MHEQGCLDKGDGFTEYSGNIKESGRVGGAGEVGWRMVRDEVMEQKVVEAPEDQYYNEG